ncbi:hypothetical protein [Novacetimonas cocois]|uniref:hypothetical protein n=1 Tax=Novacetimonas cocois TaxID=1747507 RepID=UPI0010577349|nr:hypothetical protein [Novacetimonas cocois]
MGGDGTAVPGGVPWACAQGTTDAVVMTRKKHMNAGITACGTDAGHKVDILFFMTLAVLFIIGSGFLPGSGCHVCRMDLIDKASEGHEPVRMRTGSLSRKDVFRQGIGKEMGCLT